MKINELHPGMNNVEVTGEIAEISEPKQIMTKFGTQVSLTNCKLKDETGEIQMALWGKQADGIEDGVKVQIKNGFTKEFRDELQLGIGKTGTIEIVE